MQLELTLFCVYPCFMMMKGFDHETVLGVLNITVLLTEQLTNNGNPRITSENTGGNLG